MYTTKLMRIGNSTGVTLPRELLAASHLERGDSVTLEAVNGAIQIAKPQDEYNKAMEIGRAFSARYRQTMAALAK
jgi:antitoxin component of MazEF toxin-antitoxin module